MRTVEFSMFGDPAEVLELVMSDRPVPGRRQALVRMTARPINPADLYMVRGHYGYLPSLPAVPGVEGCGVVEALGPDATGYRVGQRVIPIMVQHGGSWSEYVVVHAEPRYLIPVPDWLDDGKAAQFTVNPLSAWLMVRYRLRLGQGDWLAQTAGASQVGRFVRHVCAAEGIRTINIVHRPERADEMREHGAEHVICSATEDVYAGIMARTGGLGVHAAIDAVGGAVAGAMARTLRPDGKLLVYGLLAGRTTPIDMSALLFKNNTIGSFWLPASLKRDPVEFAHAARELIDHPLLEQITGAEATYDLAKIGEAVRHAERSGRTGKVLLTG
jgi:NADPH2:quinone reductase